MDLRNNVINKFFTDRLREVPRNVRASMPKPVDYFDPAKGSRIVSSAKPLMSPNLARAVAGTSMLGNIAGRVATPFALISEAQKVFNPKDNIITALQNFGTINLYTTKNGGSKWVSPVEVVSFSKAL